MLFMGRHALLKIIFLVILLSIAVAVISVAYFEQQLPDVETLKTIKMQVPLRIYNADGQLIAEFGEKHRVPVSLQDIPKLLIEALIATEDQRYYEHPGVDIIGLMRAGLDLITTRKKNQGGSTITMQIARNFFLSREKTFSRKTREILLALKISRELNKDKVLELYLNEVYLGNRAYGVVAAAQVYYGKALKQLTLGEIAILAGLPKAPSALNPLTDPAAAKDRRHHVLSRMLELNYITQEDYDTANKESINSQYHSVSTTAYAPYVAEAVRSQMVEQYGNEAYTMGLKVYTTIDSKLQCAATAAVRRAVINYDKRHGYRGAITNWGTPDTDKLTKWKHQLKALPVINNFQPAVILSVGEQNATALISTGATITIPWTGLNWARCQLANGLVGPKPTKAAEVVKTGDLVQLKPNKHDGWCLTQLPIVQGALISLNPQNGAVLAMVGGYSFEQSSFNRIYQAQRQPGSSFKPFVYAAALDKGLTLATVMNDAPFVATGLSALDMWRPKNDDMSFMGPIRLRTALVRSRNLVSVRVLQAIGIPYTLNYLKRFGFAPASLPNNLSLVLGSADLAPIKMAVAFSVFANGGYKINDYLIDHIVDEQNKVLYQAQPLQACEACITLAPDAPAPAVSSHQAPRVISPQVAYLMTSALQSMIQGSNGYVGTGQAAKILNRSDIGGKTGTTNEQKDGWFNGFNSDIVTIAWMGFDQPQSLYEFGAQIALPMWIDYMRTALQGKPLHTMPHPPGLITVKINPKTGALARPGESDAIFETFITGTAPIYGEQNMPSNILSVAVPPGLKKDNSVYAGVY